jgi:uncharacterized glyoxalase superfamily protein PhnB
MQVNPYLLFNGQCEAAFKFYERCLGGKLVGMMTHGESPMSSQGSPEWRSKIIHARLAVGDEVLMGPTLRRSVMKRQKASPSPSPSRNLRKQSAFFRNWRKAARCRCQFKRLSGPSVLACSSINLEFLG